MILGREVIVCFVDIVGIVDHHWFKLSNDDHAKCTFINYNVNLT